MIQHTAVRFICNLKGRASISKALKRIEMNDLRERRKLSRHRLLTRILSDEECHNVLTSSYDDLMNKRPPNASITRVVARREPQTIYARSSIYARLSIYHSSFIPRTVREMKAKLEL